MGKKSKKQKPRESEETMEEPDIPMEEGGEQNTATDEPQTEEKSKSKSKSKSESESESNKDSKRKRDQVKIKVECMKVREDNSLPILGYFPSGYSPLKNKEQQQQRQPTVRVFKHAKRRRFEVVVTPKESQIDFVGNNYAGEATVPQTCNYALGVFDKTSQTLKIVPIEANKIFRLEPRIRGADVPAGKPSEEVTEEQIRADKLKSLDFSSKRTENRVKKALSLHLPDDPRSQKELDMILSTVEVNKEALEVAESTAVNARNIPPHVLSATEPQNIYPLERIIFKGEWEFLLDIIELLREGKEITPDHYPVFVCNRIKNLSDVKDEAAKENLGCVLSYITHLIKYKEKNSINASSSSKHHKFPSILTQKFNTMYGNPNSKWLTDDKKSLLISYILVLTLFVDKFKTSPSDIAKDLKMSPIELRPHFEHLGCKFVKEKAVVYAMLHAPVQFPKIRRRRSLI